jgi:1,4-dihydroxy-2-naphthoyl-CoA hydrolase
MTVYNQTFPIHIHDVDAAGIVFFGKYFTLAHNVYEQFLADIGHSIPDAIDAGEYIIPIAHSECDYHRPIRHGETMTGRLRLTGMRGTSFVVQITLTGADHVKRATVTTRHVCVNTQTMKPMALPDSLRAALKPYCDEE